MAFQNTHCVNFVENALFKILAIFDDQAYLHYFLYELSEDKRDSDH